MEVKRKRRNTLSQLPFAKGDKYSFLTLTGNSNFIGRHRYVECTCVCGKIINKVLRTIKSGDVKSCGCQVFRYNLLPKINTHPIYRSWCSMKERCYDFKAKGYKNYGGRGIKVCDEWANDFKAFFKWSLHNGWRKGLTIDKKDNNKNYSPENCKWSTRKEQNRNKRNNVIVVAFGEIKCLKAWGEDKRCKVTFWTIKKRLNEGWSSESAISTPPYNKGVWNYKNIA